MLLMHANNREDIKEAYAGDIVALAGLKDTRTGDTLCDPQKPVILEKMEFPEPVIEIAIEPKTKADQEKIGVALASSSAEDPSFRVNDRPGIRPDHHQRAWASLHLDIKVDILKRTYKVDANVGAPQVAYRETITQAATSTTPTRSRPAARASSRASRSSLEPAAAGSGLRVRERGRRRQRAEGIHPGRREGRRRRCWAPASWPASRWSTSRSASSTASTTTSTPRRSPSRSPRARRCARRAEGAARCCSSRS